MLPYIVLGIFAICFLIYFYKQFQIRKYGITTTASVSRILQQERASADSALETSTTVYVVFLDESGEKREAVLSTVPALEVGQTITIRYNPKDKTYANYVE